MTTYRDYDEQRIDLFVPVGHGLAARQSAGVPLTVRVKVSQLTPSTQVLSPL